MEEIENVRSLVHFTYVPKLIPPYVSSLGLDRLWPMGQFWPASCFWTVQELILVFLHFFNCWKISKKENENNILWHIKIICNSNFSVEKESLIDMQLCSFTYVCSWFCATVARLSTWGEDSMSVPHSLYFTNLVIYRKSLLAFGLI